eukprot:CAMPEP_0198345746 /NCGR_PEP_ID=MMETSP1450-20131203/75828_1 /TAXON_ID=753684 ORGANISM="Madagascaria erythrocladiodes, Strain CCMP3234" /NCGR_SAMPLE_ID=MMETSP1450 /ASSEMBLY_ACC=CAM_ASM_001115 /LENGTH=33 /DNA_ID= /DNA_START= /DNA_END= /DNA_ORIENTATION=
MPATSTRVGDLRSRVAELSNIPVAEQKLLGLAG